MSLAAATLLASVGLVLAAPQAPLARADACPDVEVAFARGTNEAPGIGYVGESFVDRLTSQLPGRTVNVYAVDYPATLNPQSVGSGANDLSQHVQSVVRSCPNTKIVVGGFSQGAAVADLVTVSPLPTEPIDIPLMGSVSLADSGFTEPLPAAAIQRIAAVAVFGNPAGRFFTKPLPMPGGLRARTTDVCADGDPVCHQPSPEDLSNFPNHDSYVARGLTDDAADFTVGKLGLSTAPAPPKKAAPPPPKKTVPAPPAKAAPAPPENIAPAPPANPDPSFAPIPNSVAGSSDQMGPSDDAAAPGDE